MLNNCQLAFGAYGTKHPIRARKVQQFLTGKLLYFGVLYEAIKLLGTTVIPEDGTSSPAYRSSVAVGFLYEFLSPLVHTLAEIPGGWCYGYNRAVSHGDSNSIIKENYDKFNGIKFPALLSSSKRVIQSSKEYHPVGQPITKTGAAIQASGMSYLTHRPIASQPLVHC